LLSLEPCLKSAEQSFSKAFEEGKTGMDVMGISSFPRVLLGNADEGVQLSKVLIIQCRREQEAARLMG